MLQISNSNRYLLLENRPLLTPQIQNMLRWGCSQSYTCLNVTATVKAVCLLALYFMCDSGSPAACESVFYTKNLKQRNIKQTTSCDVLIKGGTRLSMQHTATSHLKTRNFLLYDDRMTVQ